MRIERFAQGVSEVIDLGSPAGYDYFSEQVVQDRYATDNIIREIRDFGEASLNEDAPDIFERFVKLDDAPPLSSSVFWLVEPRSGAQVSGPYRSFEEAATARAGTELLVSEWSNV